jgi:hypothetical protein
MTQFIEALVLVDGENVDIDDLRSRAGSLQDAKGLLIGNVSGSGDRLIVHIVSNTVEALGNAFIAISQVPGVAEVIHLTLTNRG